MKISVLDFVLLRSTHKDLRLHDQLFVHVQSPRSHYEARIFMNFEFLRFQKLPIDIFYWDFGAFLILRPNDQILARLASIQPRTSLYMFSGWQFLKQTIWRQL